MARGRWTGVLFPLVAFGLVAPAMAQDGRATIALRMRELLTILNGGGQPGASFTRAYLADVPELRLREIARKLRAQLGRATSYRLMAMRDAHGAEVVIAFEHGTARGTIVAEPGGKGQIAGLWIDTVIPDDVAALRTFDAVATRMAALPGKAALAIVPAQEPALASLRVEQPMAIGSAFKLVVLAELVRAVDAGERGWNDQIMLGTRELPAGQYRGQPAGTQVSLRHLAEAMIRTSDNSATDVLLRVLGRERVEAMQATIGLRNGALNVPFLYTMELFKLKGVSGGALGRRYMRLDPDQRRRLLDNEAAASTGAEAGDVFADGRPVMIEQIEWFASPMDLVRAMRWFATQAQHPAGVEALRILALNPGPGVSLRERFAYVGYKGGSEPGVLNMTVLIRDTQSRWTVVTASWNDPAQAVDEALFAALITQALTLLAAR